MQKICLAILKVNLGIASPICLVLNEKLEILPVENIKGTFNFKRDFFREIEFSYRSILLLYTSDPLRYRSNGEFNDHQASFSHTRNWSDVFHDTNSLLFLLQ